MDHDDSTPTGSATPGSADWIAVELREPVEGLRCWVGKTKTSDRPGMRATPGRRRKWSAAHSAERHRIYEDSLAVLSVGYVTTGTWSEFVDRTVAALHAVEVEAGVGRPEPGCGPTDISVIMTDVWCGILANAEAPQRH